MDIEKVDLKLIARDILDSKARAKRIHASYSLIELKKILIDTKHVDLSKELLLLELLEDRIKNHNSKVDAQITRLSNLNLGRISKTSSVFKSIRFSKIESFIKNNEFESYKSFDNIDTGRYEYDITNEYIKRYGHK